MCASSAFSKRRGLLRRPKVCRPPPPPPPPPLPDDWPPDCFSALVEYCFPWEEGPICREFTTTACRDPDGLWWWASAFAGEDFETVDWFVNPTAWTATLNAAGSEPEVGDWVFESNEVIVIPLVPTLYIISDWDVTPGEGWTCVVTFTF